MDAQLFHQALGIPTRRRIYLMGKPNATDVSYRSLLFESDRVLTTDSASELLNPFLGPYWWKVSLQRDFLQFQRRFSSDWGACRFSLCALWFADCE